MEIFLLITIIAIIAPKNILSFLSSILLIGSLVYIVVWFAALSLTVAVLASN